MKSCKRHHYAVWHGIFFGNQQTDISIVEDDFNNSARLRHHKTSSNKQSDTASVTDLDSAIETQTASPGVVDNLKRTAGNDNVRDLLNKIKSLAVKAASLVGKAEQIRVLPVVLIVMVLRKLTVPLR